MSEYRVAVVGATGQVGGVMLRLLRERGFRVIALLDGDPMIGDSEQYASAMALMARELGLPARVVLGFRADAASPDAAAEAASPDGAVTLATTAAELLRSTDTGRSWTPTPGAPPVVLADWADADVVTGITADGTVAVSTDAGLTWQLRGTTAPPQAITATTVGDGTLRVVLVTAAEILDSTDGGLTFKPLR